MTRRELEIGLTEVFSGMERSGHRVARLILHPKYADLVEASPKYRNGTFHTAILTSSLDVPSGHCAVVPAGEADTLNALPILRTLHFA